MLHSQHKHIPYGALVPLIPRQLTSLTLASVRAKGPCERVDRA